MIRCARDAGIEVLGNQAKNPAELLVARGGRILLDDCAGEIVVAVPTAAARTLWPSPKECCPLPRVPTAATLWVSAGDCPPARRIRRATRYGAVVTTVARPTLRTISVHGNKDG